MSFNGSFLDEILDASRGVTNMDTFDEAKLAFVSPEFGGPSTSLPPEWRAPTRTLRGWLPVLTQSIDARIRWRNRATGLNSVLLPCSSARGEDAMVIRSFFSDFESGRPLESQGGPSTFLELGALDGVDTSNTAVFERCLGWRGVLAEALPSNFARCAILPRDIPSHAQPYAMVDEAQSLPRPILSMTLHADPSCLHSSPSPARHAKT